VQKAGSYSSVENNRRGKEKVQFIPAPKPEEIRIISGLNS
jgi:hypothetical protein